MPQREVINCGGIRCTWNPLSRETKKRISKLQQRAINAILEMFPGTIILKEVGIPIFSCPSKTLFLDIYLPKFNIAIEVHGKQHNNIVTWYHTKSQWRRQHSNDELKARFCEINFIPLLYFHYNETEDVWKSKLKEILKM